LTQEETAEALGMDVGTIKGWETGRRPIGRVQVGRLAQVRRRLRELGARPALLANLDTAVTVDDFTAQAIAGDCSALGSEVVTRSWMALATWAVCGRPPATAQDVAPEEPLLSAEARKEFFASVTEATERAPAGPAGDLLRHQAYYVAAWHPVAGADLVQRALRSGRHARLEPGTWTPAWAVTRSLAVAAACAGDTGPLEWFTHRHLSEPVCQDANLVYWAYWVGAVPDAASSEEFMVAHGLGVQQASHLLRHLAVNLCPALPYSILSVHTIWSICRRWPELLGCDAELAAHVAAAASAMLDNGSLPATARRELSDVHAQAIRAGAQRSREAGWR
jgi:hypothetical protein